MYLTSRDSRFFVSYQAGWIKFHVMSGYDVERKRWDGREKRTRMIKSASPDSLLGMGSDYRCR